MTPSDKDKGKGKGKGKSSKRRRLEATGEPSQASPSVPQPRQPSEGMEVDRPSPRTHPRDRKLARVRKAKPVPVEEPSKTPSPERPDPTPRLQEVSVDNLTDQLNALYVSSLLIKFVPGMESLDNDFIVGSRLKKVSQKIRSAKAAKDYHPSEKPRGRKTPQKHLTKKEALKKHPRLSPRGSSASALPLPSSLNSLSDRDILAVMMTRSRYLRLVIDGTTHESALDRLRIDYGNNLRIEDMTIIYELGQEIQTSLMKHKSVAKATQTGSDGASTSQAAIAMEASRSTAEESVTEPESAAEANETDTEESDDDDDDTEEVESHEEDSNESD